MDSNQSLNPVTETKPSPTTPENKALIQIAGGYYDQQVWAVMKMMAQTFIDAKAFPSDIVNVPQAMVRLQAGRELGLMPIESMKYISLISGRPSLWGEKAIEMVISAGHRVEWSDCNDKTATCTITRGDTGKSMTQTFTIEMANVRGLTKKGGPWLTAPENMLKFKAFHAIAKFLVPDALRGASIAEIEETEMPNMSATVINNGTNTQTMAVIESSVPKVAALAGKLKPFAERMAEKVEKPAVVEDEKKAVVEAKVVTAEPAAVKPEEEPTYEPITPPEPPTPVIQVETPSPLPPPKKAEGIAARKMREAAEKAVAAKSPNDF